MFCLKSQTVIHAFITSCLDYCNSLFYGISKSQVARLQLVENAAAKFLKNGRKYDHATPILRALHWLPVHVRNDFKVPLFVCNFLLIFYLFIGTFHYTQGHLTNLPITSSVNQQQQTRQTIKIQ